MAALAVMALTSVSANAFLDAPSGGSAELTASDQSGAAVPASAMYNLGDGATVDHVGADGAFELKMKQPVTVSGFTFTGGLKLSATPQSKVATISAVITTEQKLPDRVTMGISDAAGKQVISKTWGSDELVSGTAIVLDLPIPDQLSSSYRLYTEIYGADGTTTLTTTFDTTRLHLSPVRIT